MKRTGKTRVFLVDDHEIFRTGLRTVLRYAMDIEITGESVYDPDLIERLEATETDVVLMGVQPGTFDTIDAIKERLTNLKILVLGGADAGITAASARKLNGYIKKESSSDFLRATIKVVALGGIVWHPYAMESLTNVETSSQRLGAGGGGAIQLSPRERNLLSLLVAGKTNKHISYELKLAQVTVKKALQSLFPKIGVANRTQAAIKASQLGLV